MGIQKIEIGDIFEVPTAIGNAYIQYMAEVDQTTLIRLLPGVYHEPVDLENKSGIMSFRALSHLRYNSFGFINNSIGKRSYASYYPR